MVKPTNMGILEVRFISSHILPIMLQMQMTSNLLLRGNNFQKTFS